MTFDINQMFFLYDNDESLDEEIDKYIDTLVQLFVESDEGKAHLEGQEADWSELFLDIVIRRIGVSLVFVHSNEMREVLYEVIPASVAIEIEEAPNVIKELKAFFQFLKREFDLPNCDSCLKVLNQKNLLKRFTDELKNPHNYSPTKTIMLQMLDANVDIDDQTQVEQFLENYNANIMEAMKPPPITEKAEAQYQIIKDLTQTVCNEHLNKEYYDVSLKLLDAFLQRYPDRLERGQAKSWAAAIVYAIGRVNFLFDSSQTPHLTAIELCQKFNVSQATASKKSSELINYFDMMQLDPEWTVPSMVDKNPFVWMVMTGDGMIADIRNAPREVQVKAYEHGLIPYVPADKK